MRCFILHLTRRKICWRGCGPPAVIARRERKSNQRRCGRRMTSRISFRKSNGARGCFNDPGATVHGSMFGGSGDAGGQVRVMLGGRAPPRCPSRFCCSAGRSLFCRPLRPRPLFPLYFRGRWTRTRRRTTRGMIGEMPAKTASRQGGLRSFTDKQSVMSGVATFHGEWRINACHH